MTILAIGVDADTILAVLEQTDEPVLCESPMEREYLGLEAHPADWYLIAPCGVVMAVCDKRRNWAVRSYGIYCHPGCGDDHSYDVLRWEPVKK